MTKEVFYTQQITNNAFYTEKHNKRTSLQMINMKNGVF